MSTKAIIIGMIQNDPDNIVYMATGHGTPDWAQVNDTERITPADIELALQNRGPMKFSFVIHPNAMDNTGPGTWSPTLRKGQTSGTVVIGIRWGMTDSEWYDWQQGWALAFFNYARAGFPFWRAYDLANQAYPNLKDHIVFEGDLTMSRRDLA